MKIGIIGSFTCRIPIPEGEIHAPLLLTQQLSSELVKRGHEIVYFGAALNNDLNRFNFKIENFGCQGLPSQLEATPDNKTYQQRMRIITEQSYAVRAFSVSSDIALFYSWSAYSLGLFSRFLSVPLVVTHHDPAGVSEYNYLFDLSYADNLYMIPISASMRRQFSFPVSNYTEPILNGVDLDDIPLVLEAGNYLAWVGRIIPRKGLHQAIEVAKATGTKLKIAGSIKESADSGGNLKNYVDGLMQEIKTRPDLLEYLGVLDHRASVELLAHAKALIFPSDGVEGCPMSPLESMVGGAPVISTPLGPMPEIIDEGLTGFLCPNVPAMIDAVNKIDQIKRQQCAEIARSRFSIATMAEKYERAFSQILEQRRKDA